MRDFDEFEEHLTAYRCKENVFVNTDKAKTIFEMSVPIVHEKELAVRVTCWIKAYNQVFPEGKENSEVSVYRNNYFKGAWLILNENPVGCRLEFPVKPGDIISVIAANGKKVRMVLSEFEVLVCAKSKEGE